MRFLLHHEDAVYDTATKTYYFNLDRRISNPTRIRVNKAAYTAATAGSYPQVVYVRSDALSEMARNKHTVELKGSDHENPSNVLCALQEGALLGRYALKDARVHQFPTHSHLPVRRIDIQFTNNRTALDGSHRHALQLEIEGPKGFIDPNAFELDGKTLSILARGIGRLWVTSILPGRLGENFSLPMVVVARNADTSEIRLSSRVYENVPASPP